MHLLEKPGRLLLEDILMVASSSGSLDAAFSHALNLAQEHGARMHFAHAGSSGFESNLEAKQALHEERCAGQNLHAILKEHEFDLAVINAGVPSGEAWPGAAARNLLLAAHCPVLALGPSLRPFQPLRSAPATILHATDFSPQALAAAQHAFSWAQEYQASVTMLHVIEGVGPQTDHERDALAAPFRSWMAELIPEELPHWCEVEHQVMFGDVAPSIVAAARELKTELIVIGLNGLDSAALALPGSNALEVVRQAECPVLLAGDYMNRSALLELPRHDRSGAAAVAA
jgi:nucleotide-binding universal stress UspA family protein